MSESTDVCFVPVGMFVNMRFAQRYEVQESTDEYEVFAGLIKSSSMDWPVRRPIVYRDSMIELRYVFRLDGVYLLFLVGEFWKEFYVRKWTQEEVGLLGRPELAYRQVERVPGAITVELFDPKVRFYPASDNYLSTSAVYTPHEIFYPVVSRLSSAEMFRISSLLEPCWLTLLIDDVLFERGVKLDYVSIW